MQGIVRRNQLDRVPGVLVYDKDGRLLGTVDARTAAEAVYDQLGRIMDGALVLLRAGAEGRIRVAPVAAAEAAAAHIQASAVRERREDADWDDGAAARTAREAIWDAVTATVVRERRGEQADVRERLRPEGEVPAPEEVAGRAVQMAGRDLLTQRSI
ncbi:MAG: hypothetical protein QJR07_20795 [Acetobacteraceae bacterium]|nr:hypothetical protein [Acetobacteraceae bacterium]